MAAETATVERAERETPRIGPTRGELIGAVSALILLVLMFAAAWYGVDGMPGAKSTSSAAAGAENAWHALSVIRWLMLLTVVVALGVVAIHARRPSRVAVARIRAVLLALSAVTAGAVVFRVLIELPSSTRVVDQKLGGVLGMTAALGIAYGAYEAVREQRARLFGLASRARDPVASGRARR